MERIVEGVEVPETTKQDLADLLENFKDYVNPSGMADPWFEVTEINQQFAWEDIAETVLAEWLSELVAEGKVFTLINDQGVQEWAWSAG